MLPVWALYLIGALGIAGISGFAGAKVEGAFKDEQLNQIKIADLQGVNDAWKLGWAARDHQAATTAAFNAKNEADQSHIGSNTQGNIVYVHDHITPKQDAACTLPNSFVSVLDATVLGTTPDQLPGHAGEPDDAPSGVTLSQATALLTQWVGDYASVRTRITNARDDWDAQVNAQQSKPAAKPSWWQRNFGGAKP